MASKTLEMLPCLLLTCETFRCSASMAMLMGAARKWFFWSMSAPLSSSRRTTSWWKGHVETGGVDL